MRQLVYKEKGICLFVLYMFLWAVSLQAQDSFTAHVEHLTTANGLSNNTVRYIYQDSKGFIWFSTLNGLNRYDGNTFRTFLPKDIPGEISLADGRVKSVCEDRYGFLWIATSADRFSCYDLKRDCFVDFTGCGEYEKQYRYITLLQDEVWLWGRGEGCRRIYRQNGTFISEVYCAGNGELASDAVGFVTQDKSGRVYIGTDKGLYSWQEGTLNCIVPEANFRRARCLSDYICFITDKGEIWSIKEGNDSPTKSAQVPDITWGGDLPGDLAVQNQWVLFSKDKSYVYAADSNKLNPAPAEWNIPGAEVFMDNRGNYWAFNRTGNLHYIQAATGKTQTFNLVPEEKVRFVDKERYHVVHDSRNILWISTYGNGLFTYNLQTNRLSHFTANDKRSSIINSDALQYVAEDRSGSIWIGSDYTGVSHLKVVGEISTLFLPQQNKGDNDLFQNNVRLLSALPKGDICLGTRDGKLYVYDVSFSRLKAKKDYHRNVYAVCEDTTGVLWAATRGGGLYVGNKHIIHQEDDAASLASNELFSILRDSKGRMWIGTFGEGLDLAVPDGKGGYTFRHFFNEYYGQKRIRTLVEDRKGWIWAGTSDGIFVFHPERLLKNATDYYHYNRTNNALHSDEIRFLMQDSQGNIWISEAGNGFAICTPDKDYGKLEFTHYEVSDGLVNNMVQAFAEDKKGQVWITTEYGVSCFDLASETFSNYFFFTRMLNNVYNETAILTLPDGRVMMGANQGVTIVNPVQIKTDLHVPAVTFTALRLNSAEESVSVPDALQELSLPYAESIRLSYDQHSFDIHFSTLDYSAVVPVKFSYMLEGFDKAWSVPSSQPYATYKNLSPGTYRLKVKACNTLGQWDDDIYSTLEIVVTPPFWRTTWAYLLYVLLAALMLYIAWRIIRRMEELRNKIKVEEELTEYKLVFFTNISHEFRTPLTLIQAALDKMHRVKSVPKEMSASIKMMDKSTRRMLRLINQLLEFRKMQNKKLALSLEEVDVIAFLYEIYLSFKDVSESKKMDFRFIPSIASYKMFVDKGKLDKIVYNLLSNAFKYTPSNGKIDFSIQINEVSRKLVIRVADTGVGIPKEKQDQLFKRFMQSSFSGSSVGVGLHLTHELVQVHKGTIAYADNPGGGSVFTVTLSIDSSVYEEQDFLIPGNVLLHEEERAHQRMLEFEKEQDAETSDKGSKEIQAPLNKQKILVIEDDTDIRELLKEELSAYFEVVAEANGTSGLERANSYDADLIVCDVMMPDISGFEVTRKLKEDFNTSHIPIILLTALDSPEGHLEGVESGADAYITKPFSIKLLLARIFKLIEQRDKLREKFSSDSSMARPVLCSNEKDKDFVEKLNRIVEEQLANPEFTVDEFASAMAMGRSVFFRKVRGVTGYAPKEYLRIIRMKKAAELLLTTDKSVTEITYLVGVNDPFYFSRCFKEQFGMSPTAYQKNKGKDAENND